MTTRIQIQLHSARQHTAAAIATANRALTILPTTGGDVSIPTLRAISVSMVKGVDGELVATIEAPVGVVRATVANDNNGAKTIRARKAG